MIGKYYKMFLAGPLEIELYGERLLASRHRALSHLGTELQLYRYLKEYH